MFQLFEECHALVPARAVGLLNCGELSGLRRVQYMHYHSTQNSIDKSLKFPKIFFQFHEQVEVKWADDLYNQDQEMRSAIIALN